LVCLIAAVPLLLSASEAGAASTTVTTKAELEACVAAASAHHTCVVPAPGIVVSGSDGAIDAKLPAGEPVDLTIRCLDDARIAWSRVDVPASAGGINVFRLITSASAPGYRVTVDGCRITEEVDGVEGGGPQTVQTFVVVDHTPSEKIRGTVILRESQVLNYSTGLSSSAVGSNPLSATNLRIERSDLYGPLALNAKATCQGCADQATVVLGSTLEANPAVPNARTIKIDGDTNLVSSGNVYRLGAINFASQTRGGAIFEGDLFVEVPTANVGAMFTQSVGARPRIRGDILVAGAGDSVRDQRLAFLRGGTLDLDITFRDCNSIYSEEGVGSGALIDAPAPSSVEWIRLRAQGPAGCWPPRLVTSRGLDEFARQGTDGRIEAGDQVLVLRDGVPSLTTR
jgi:hypothetical protein